jgi:molecular chaperone DnaK
MRSNAERYVQSKIETRLYDLLDSQGLKFPSETLSAYLSEQHGTICFKDVVLSVPAYFNDNQKRATRDSAEIAGLCVQRLLHEPTAAALAYSYQKPYSGKLVVVDLGGGTLDISIVEIAEGVTEVQEVGGDTKLGGSDIDALLVQHVADDIWQRWGIEFSETAHSSEIARLRDACEHLKINLSSLNQDTIKLVHFLNRPVYTFTMTRTELERLSKPVLDRIRATITRTIENHGAGLDHFLLVGNATKMPAVGALVRQTIPARQLAGIDPGTVVATGAALQASIMAGELTQVLVLDVVPYSLGIAAFHGQAEKEAISRLIAANSTIPIAKSSIYSTKWDNQRNAHIKVYQGESPEPLMNYFLGDLVLEGIPPAPAGTPQIEVVFEIGADCILTVTAVDKASGNEQSLRIERAVALSPQEKQDLGNYFAQRERLQSVERELESVRRDIDELRPSCAKAISTAQRSIEDFAVRFHEKVQVHPQLYKVEPEQVREIQEMIIHQDQLTRSLSKYQDQFNSILENIRQIEAKHLDFTDSEIAAKLRARIDSLSHYRQALRHGLDSLETNVVAVLTAWNQILESMEPDSEKMDPLEFANYHLTAGRANQAKEILEALASSADGLTKEAYHLLLKCYVSLGLRDEYRETHRRLGSLFGEIHPEFHRLNTYLKAIADSIFMIQGVSDGSSALAGSGFCITPNLIVTNRHVVQGRTSQQLRIIGKSATYPVERLELDPLDDLAILQVAAQLRPLSLGEFHFVEPGEQVLAIGFPHPDSNIHGENLYISKGIVNSIRKTEISSERVIFIDAKIGGGMSGGPLINELGEVIGVVTSVRYRQAQSEDRTLLVEDQPIALPIHLVRKYVRGTH